MKVTNLERIRAEGQQTFGNEQVSPIGNEQSLTDQFLAIQKQRNASAGYQELGDEKFTEQFLDVREQRNNMTMEERVDAKVQAIGTETPSSFVSNPFNEETVKRGEELVDRLDTLKVSFDGAKTALITAQNSLGQARTTAEAAGQKLQQARQTWATSRTEENVGLFRSALTEYSDAYSAYTSAYNAYSQAYDAYKAQEDEMVGALADYKVFLANYNNWKENAPQQAVEEGKKKGVGDYLLDAAATFIPAVRLGKTIYDVSKGGYIKGSKAFEDGYDFGDVTKTALGTVRDAAEDTWAGIIGTGETLLDAGMMIAPYLAQGQYYQNGGAYQPIGVQQLNQQAFDTMKAGSQEFVGKDLYDEQEVAKVITSAQPLGWLMDKWGINTEEASILDEKADSLFQSAGQLGAQMAVNAIPGMQGAGLVMSGLSAMGSESENALKSGATLEEAALSGMITGAAEVLTEQLSGGIKFGGKTADDWITKKIARTITDTTARNLAKIGVDFVGEGAEEALSGIASRFGQWLTYRNDEHLWNDVLASEKTRQELWDEFLAGGLLGGFSSVGKVAFSSANGVDAVTGLTKDEQAFVDQAYKEALAEAEKGGKVTEKQKAEIYDDILEQQGYSSVLQKAYDLKNVTENDAQEIINSGLESAQGTESYKLAVQLKAKLDAGKIPSAGELGRLLVATEIEIQQEGAAAGEGADVAEPGGLSLPTLEDDAAGDLKTNAVSRPLESYPAEKQTMIRSYINAVDEKIRSFVQSVKNGDLSFKRQKISDVSERAAADIKRLLGVDAQGYTHNINTNGVKHIIDRHGESGSHDSTMSADDDVARIGWVLENYDTVEPLLENGKLVYSSEFRDSNDRPAPQIRFSKKIDGSYYVVEAACVNSHEKLWVQSAYLRKNEDVTQVLAEGQQANHETNARSALASPSSKTIIDQGGGNVNTGADTELRGLSLPTLDDVAPAAGSVAERGGNVTQMPQNVTATPQNVTENQMINTAVPAGEAVPVAAQSGESQNGGTPYVNTQVRGAGPAAAQPAGRSTGAGGNGILSGSGQRNAGTGTGEQAGSLDSRAGSVAAKQSTDARVNRIREAAARSNLARILQLEKVSAVDVGLKSGTNTKSLQILPQEHWDAELQTLAQKIREETGKEPVFVVGDLRAVGKDGKSFLARAAITDTRVIVLADYFHREITLDQVVDHEIFHDRARTAREDGYDLNAMIEEKILERYTMDEFSSVLDAYIVALRGRFGLDGAESGAQYEAAMAKIEEELYADAYAGINAFGENAGKFTGAVDESLNRLHLGRNTAQENGVRQTNGPPAAKENTADVGGESYSADDRYDYSKPFAEQVEDYKKGLIPKGDSLILGETPDVFRSIGFNAIPMTINTTHVDYALNGTKDADHLLGETMLKQLPEKIKDPIAVFVSQTHGTTSVIALLDFTVNGKQVITPVTVDGFGWQNAIQIDSNAVTSAYGKTTAVKQLHQAAVNEANGRFSLLYANKKEAVSLLHRAGHQLSGTLIPRDGFYHSIRENGSPVKVKFNNATETQQFKRWFGDWQKHPKNASKIVNADGTPKVMYHGTSAENGDFYVFDAGKASKKGGLGLKALGKGNYFTAKQLDGTERYGSRVIAAYLNIKRPFVYDGGSSIMEQAAQEFGIDTEGMTYDDLQQEMRDRKYDGVIQYDSNGDVALAVAFDSNQIKSVDNIGTFDGENPDIRYSVDDQTEAEIAAKEELIAALQELTPEQMQTDRVRQLIEQYTTRPQPKVQTPALKIDRANLRRALNSTLGLTKEQSGQLTQVLDKFTQDVKPKRAAKPKAELDVQSKPTEAKKILQKKLLDLFSVPAGQRGAMGNFINNFADRIVKNGKLTEADRKAFFTAMYEAGAMTVPADEYYANARSYIKGGHIFVPDSVVADFGDDWGDIRRRAFAAGIYLTRSRVNENGSAVSGIDVWNNDLASELPGLFDSEATDRRAMLEQIVRVAEMGREEQMSLGEYVARIAGEEYTSENDVLDSMERQMTWALKSFAETARVEIELKDNNLRRVLKERQENREVAQRAKDRKELQELQKKTMKQLQWLSRNRYKAPEDLQAVWDEVLGDIDLYAIGAANEMNWSEKYGATWKDLAAMYKAAEASDDNFMPSEDLKKIVRRLDAEKIGDMDLGALQDLYKAAVGLRTEFYNRNNVVGDEMHRLFAEVYADAKNEIQNAPGGFAGKWADKFLNMDQLTPMNVLQRMGGWDPNGVFYSMAKQLEHGERDMRAYRVKAQRLLQEFLTEHEDWVKKADGQGKDAVWYELEVPELMELRMGDKPIFGDTVKVYMTPSQKVHLYLESKNLDNLRHMTGGRTFVNKELYSKGKRQEALAQGRTIRLAPETVKAIVSDLTAEELELARILEQYYNVFAKDEINRVSNILYGYDKAMGKNYAPIYTNHNYTKAEFGVFDVTAEGVGNLKGRQHASNPSYNLSAFDAFERHVEHTARFVGMAIPARNWTALMNWKENGNSTADVISHKWGDEGKRYITDLITTLQAGDELKMDTASEAVGALQNNYISAVFGANPSIVLKQLGSIPLAGAYLGATNVPTPAQIARIDTDLISKYSQDLAWRTMGYTTPETKQLKENPNWTQTNKFVKFTFGGGAITAMDGWAASTLWPWAENKVRREHPDLEVGTDAQIAAGESPFYKKVAQEFEDAMSRSQSVSDEIHQSSLRKSKNPITRTFTLFRSDSAQTYNALRQKIGEAQFYKRTGADEKVKKAATTAVGTVVCALLMNAVWSEAVSFLMAMWKNKGKYYRDDEEKLTAESVVGEMGRNMLESIMGTVTFGDEIAQLIGNAITGDQRYDLEAPGLEQLNEIFNLIQDLLQGNFGRISEAVDLVKNGGNLGKYISDNSGDILGEIKETAIKAATYFGVPINNMEAYLIGALKWVSPELGTAYDDLFIDAGKSDLVGLEGGALETRVQDILVDRHISNSEETAQILAGLYAEGHTSAMPSDTPSSVTVNEEKHELSEHQKQVYDTVWGDLVADGLDALVSSEAFAGADQETQAKMLARLYSYAADRAKAELFDQYSSSSAKTVDQMRAEGLDLADCISWGVESSGLKQEEKFALLREWDLTDGQKKAVMGTILGTDLKTAAGNPTQYAEMLEALENGLTVDQYIDLRTGGGVGDYSDLVEGGLDPDEAYELVEDWNNLQPADGKDGVSDLQKWRVCVDFSDDVDDQLTALFAVMTEKQFQKVEIANDFGVTPNAYVTLLELRPKYDANGNGSYTQAEIRAAIDNMPGRYTTSQKAVLWQLVTGSSSAKNNPYDQQIGQKVLDAKSGSAGSSSGSSDSFSDEVMRQLMGE